MPRAPRLQANGLRVPLEILIMIVEQVKLASDLARLSRSSKLLQAIAQPLLYHSLTTMVVDKGGILSQKQHTRLFRTIRHVPRLSALVTELTHTIQPNPPCVIHGQTLSCSCDAYERKLGLALGLLSSLRNLHLACRLHGPRHKPHPYLLASTEQRLQRFSLFCNCCDRPEKYAASLLMAPLISSVTTLCLQVSPSETHAGSDLYSVEPTFLPNVKAISFDGCWISNMIMKHRQIERIHLLKWTLSYTPSLVPLSRAISAGPGNPNALFVDDALEWLPSLFDNMQAFINLTVLGMFAFPHTPDEDILDQMEVLTSLSHLTSIHISRKHYIRKYHAEGFRLTMVELNPQFIDALGSRLPMIKRVMVHFYPHEGDDPTPVVWEKEDVSNRWTYTGSLESYFSVWDLLEGKAD